MFQKMCNKKECYQNSFRKLQIKCQTFPLLLAAILFLVSSLSFPVKAAEADYQSEAEARKEMAVESNEWENWPLGPQLGAQSAILMEAKTGTILYAKNIHDHLYPASITKILTGLIAIEQCPLDDVVTYSNEAVNSIDWRTDSNIGIKAGEQITVEQSLYGLLVGSANEAANALGEHISGSMEAFAELMNERAAQLGCVDSHFVTTNGIHDENHYTSAYDMALIARAFFDNDMLCKISSTANYIIPRSATVSEELYVTSRNQLLPGKEYAYEYLVGSKTGYTSEARQTLVSCAQKDGMKLICVVMKEESPSQFTDTIDLFNYGFSNFHMVNVADEDTSYTVGNNSFFESDSDVFGNSTPILSINPSDVIILPNTAEYEDAVSTLSYEDAQENGSAAVIEFTYNGVYVGSASVDIASQEAGDPSQNSLPVAVGTGGDGTSSDTDRIYINILHVVLGAIGIFLFLWILFWLITLIREYSFSTKKKEKRRRKIRKKQDYINFDRYTKDDF